MRHHHIAAIFVLFTMAVLPDRGEACSVVDDYRVPTNLELVRQSQLILRGRIIGAQQGKSVWESKLVVEPIEAVKGELPNGTIEILGGSLVPSDDTHGFAALSNPYAFEEAHPLSYIGGCVRTMFPKNTVVLFFLEREGNDWRAAGGPFSRWAEDVLSDDAPWLQLTRVYTRASEAQPDDGRAMLEAERDRLLNLGDQPVARLMALDIQRQLKGPNLTWNQIMSEAVEGSGTIPTGSETEAAANALARLILDDSSDDAAAMDETGAEATAVICSLSDDEKSVECDGAIYHRTEGAEGRVAQP